jgi:hypothetical protein
VRRALERATGAGEHVLHLGQEDPAPDPLGRELAGLTRPVLAGVGGGKGGGENRPEGALQPVLIIGGGRRRGAGGRAAGEKRLEAAGAQRLGHLMEGGLGGMIDPVAVEVIGGADGVLLKLLLHALGKELAHVVVFGEGNVRPLVPSEALALLGVQMPVQVQLFLQQETTLVAEMIGSGQTRQTGTEDQIHRGVTRGTKRMTSFVR